jgi:ribosomal-protein-alanine N-acetyltransferase
MSWSLTGPDDLARIVDACEAERDDTTARFAIVDDSDGSLAGTIALLQIVWRFRTAELAYDLDPRHAGRGLATACARAVTDWMLDAKDFIRIEATTLDTNRASRHVLEKVGYVHEGLMRSKKLVRGLPRDFHLFAKTRTP